MLAHHYSAFRPMYTDNATSFLPPIPSPLSPRSVNISNCNGPVYMSSEPLKPNQQSLQSPRPEFSKRVIKKAPLAGQDALKEKRRGMFLRKVADARDDKRFESRGEDIMRLDFVQRRKQWEAEQARAAPTAPSDPVEAEEEELRDVPESSAMHISTQEQAPGEQVDEVAMREMQELNALLSFLPGEEDGMVQTEQDPGHGGDCAAQQDDPMSEHFGSDDDDYDALFSDYLSSQAVHSTQLQQSQPLEPMADAMDMS